LAQQYSERDVGQHDPEVPPARHLTNEQKAADNFLSRHMDKATEPAPRGMDIQATVITLSGCQDNQESSDGANHGLFTQMLLDVWGPVDKPSFKGNYQTLHSTILARMPPQQTPGYLVLGTQNRDFEQQQPFTISP